MQFPAFLQEYRQHYPDVTPFQLLSHIGYYCPDKKTWFLKPGQFEDQVCFESEDLADEEEEIDDPEEDLDDIDMTEDDVEVMDCTVKTPESQPTPESGTKATSLPLQNACEDHWSWNTKERSHEIRLNGPKHRIAHFHPNWSNGTAGIRGTRILNKGRYYWEVNVSQRIFGTR